MSFEPRNQNLASTPSFDAPLSVAAPRPLLLRRLALIVVLSVMNGFQKEVRDRMLSVLAHVEVFDASGSLPNWQATAAEVSRHPLVRGAAPYVEA